MKQNRKAGRVVDSVITHIVLIVVCFIFFFPCLWLILASFSKSGSIYSFRGFFPTEFSLDTFKATPHNPVKRNVVPRLV